MKAKEYKRIRLESSQSKEARVALLISDKADFKMRNTATKEAFPDGEEIIHWGYIKYI